ncbi:twin-arginine translocase subunit TatC [Brevibacterium litoralis]|uniref:twin-arginine translocase subunit TatC n=1 Tax=Brevibacterium litoralis TaxID=3138935 RepID=UPI0032ECB318
MKKTRNPERTMPLMGHLKELRNRMLVAGFGVLVGAVAGWFLYDPVLQLLQAPVKEISDQAGRVAEVNFASVASPFDMKIKISLFIGVLVSSPVWLFQAAAFILPGLTKKEKKYALSFVFASLPLFIGGSGLAWFAIPKAVEGLTSFTPEGSTNIIPAQDYLTFVMVVIVVFGLAFVLPVFMVGFNMLGILSAKRIQKSWRWLVVLIFVFAAMASPAPDVLSMFILVVPMTVLFSLAWLLCFLHDRRVKKKMIADGTWVEPEE